VAAMLAQRLVANMHDLSGFEDRHLLEIPVIFPI
jgi:hypothetical protein